MKCLLCGKEIPETAVRQDRETQWHSACVRRFFGTEVLPELDISDDTLMHIAVESTNRGFTVPGVQKKMSLHLLLYSVLAFCFKVFGQQHMQKNGIWDCI